MSIPAQHIDLGLIAYTEAWQLQHELVGRRLRGEVSDLLLTCEHPDVITVGRRQEARSSILEARFPVVEVERGGGATYHGPGQLVGYPILLLGEQERDLHRYLRRLEEGLIALCGRCGVPASRRTGLTGVWTADGQRKLASLGVAVRRWVTFHGFALNVTTDLGRFAALTPCGLDARVMTSLAGEGGRLQGRTPTVADLLQPAAECLGAALGRTFAPGALESLVGGSS
ncbi:MAG: lipoyl(octanoyl) transferase LipB [Myxococcales bacterium]|nr:lipoyl(octanoyl) transferase LipB [Myxococcota bacterium]MDW8281781.1 lipoyl(octanoyl) transferase LipB [Myxococcales bacterium]